MKPSSQATGATAVVVARGDGRVIGQNAHARELMGDGHGLFCWAVVGALEAEGLPCRNGCVRELLTSGMDCTLHTRISLAGRRHSLTCVPFDGAVICSLSSASPQSPESWELLTCRERDVLRLLSKGKTTPEIATELGLSNSTVKTHVEHMRDKLGVPTRAALVARAFDLGF